MTPEAAFKHHKIPEWEAQEKERREHAAKNKATRQADRSQRGSYADKNNSGRLVRRRFGGSEERLVKE